MKNSKERGQTLIEVVTGLGMLAIVVVALIGMGVVALKTSSSARNRTVAVKLANEGMEIARSVRDQSGLATVVTITDPTITVGSVDFARTRTVSATGDPNKKKIVVEVSWSESSGTKTTSVTSYLTDWR